MAGRIAKWANANTDLWKSKPVRGELGIVWIPESQMFNYVQQGSTEHYAQSARGAYQAFFDSNIQADFVHIEDVGQYPLIYLPYPIHLRETTVRKLISYVQNGGVLVSEGFPGYFGDRGKVGTRQPNYGMDELFGARESYVEFTPDLLEDLTFTVREQNINGRYFIQEYEPTKGRATGRYANGTVAAVENQFGKGRTLLIGSFPGSGYYRHSSPQSRTFFAGLLDWAGIRQNVTSSDPLVRARLHRGGGGNVLYVVNPTREERNVFIDVPQTVRSATDVWQKKDVKFVGQRLQVTVEDRNVAVIRFD
jgi:beta-galactosidase